MDKNIDYVVLYALNDTGSETYGVGLISHGGPIELFFSQPVVHNWFNIVCGMCCPVCGMVRINDPLLLIEKSNPSSEGSGFFLMLCDHIICQHHITINKMC